MSIIYQSCEKEQLVVDPVSESIEEYSNPNVFNIGRGYAENRSGSGLQQTVLGPKLPNPVSVENWTAAHNSLYGTSIDEVQATDYHVKFSPSSIDDLKLLIETEEDFFDFPYGYEIIELGDYYQDVQPGEHIDLYAVVPGDFSFPDVDYEILDGLYLDFTDKFVLIKSYILLGLTDRLATDIPPIYPDDARPTDDHFWNPPVPPSGFACPDDCEIIAKIVGYNEVTGFPIWTHICECEPADPPVNQCGCPIEHERNPAGCIRVEDTQLSTAEDPTTFEPVRRVKVIARNGYSIFEGWIDRVTWTDDNGCFLIDELQYDGAMWMWIEFRNNRCKIRGVETGLDRLYEWMFPIKDPVGKTYGPNFRDIEVNYHMYENTQTQAHRYWGAATINNSVHEFHDYAIDEGIAQPPNGIDIFAAIRRQHGYALMSAQSIIETVGDNIIMSASYLTGPFAPLISLGGVILFHKAVPEMCIGTDFVSSDRVKRIAYHEMTHASHYSMVGHNYWKGLVLAEIFALGHGNSNSIGAPLIALCESWGDHVGMSFNHRTYMASASLTPAGQTWERELEETWNEWADHIPIGLFHDLIDDGTEPLSTNQQEAGSTTVVDNVSGFENGQFNVCLGLHNSSIAELQLCLLTFFIDDTGNMQQDVEDLFDSY